MSQRAATRGFFLCILAVLTVLTALPSAAQTGAPGTITFSPSGISFGIGETSEAITAHVSFPANVPISPGPQTLTFPNMIYTGVSTIPSTITFNLAAGQTSANVSFRLFAATNTWPMSRSESAYSSPSYATGTLSFVVEPIGILPDPVVVRAGGTSGTVTAYVSYGDITPRGPQELVFDGLPAGVTTDPSPMIYTVGPNQFPGMAQFQLVADTTAVPGTYTVSVSNTPLPAGPVTFTLVVQPGGSFTAAVEKPVVNLCPGGSAVANTLTVTPVDPYTGTPTVTFPGLPTDLIVTPLTFDMPLMPPAQSAGFEISARPWSTASSREVTVVVNDPSGISASTTFVVNVVTDGYAPALAPASVALAAGGPASTVTVSATTVPCGPPPASITVTPSGLPAGVTATPSSVTLVAPAYGPATFTLSASGDAPVGSAAATLTYVPSAGSTMALPLAVAVSRPGQIGVSVERASMDACPGGAATSNSLTISPLDGYAGTPTVTFPGLPAGLTIAPSPIVVPALPPAQLVPFAVTAAAGTPAGPVTVTALVSDPRGMSATATFVVNVLPPAFTAAATPSALTLNPGGTAASITVSIVAGNCVPTAAITVTPSGLPPGVTVTPASAILGMPTFAPVTFSFQASPAAAPGPSTVTFTFASGGTTKTATAVITVCGAPGAPVSPVVRPQGNPSGPVTATDFLALGWGAPASGFAPTRYEWRINGGSWTASAVTSASAPPRGTIDPVQLFVRAYSCSPEKGPGAEASSPVYPLAPPVASFSVPASIVAGRPATFTDTSSPQATSWLWFPGAAMAATTVQSPTVTFPSAGPQVIVLVATNGSGSSTKSTTVNVLLASSSRGEASLSVRSLGRESDGRLALERVAVGPGTTLLLRRLEGEGEAVAWLRLVDANGRVVVERRLVLAAGEEARHDLSAFATGEFRVEVVGTEGLDAAVEATVPAGGEEIPVEPRHPRGEGLR